MLLGAKYVFAGETAQDDSFLSDANVSIDTIGETGFIKMAQIHIAHTKYAEVISFDVSRLFSQND